MGLLDGKVALVTGAGNGIGRDTAMAAARAGAKVVVNDLGGAVAGGDGGTQSPAQAVVDEIAAAGGEAVANFGSIADRKAVADMVTQALDTFGGLHHVINPAGIIRDVPFHEMNDEDFDLVIDVHLRGAYNVSRAAINHFRDQGEGNFVHFTSTSGLIGNVRQSNYGAAKMGVAGLSRILAMENFDKGVRSNAIAPYAWTRMFEAAMPDDPKFKERMLPLKDRIRGDQVGTFVIGLCADRSTTGQIFAVRGNEVYLMSQPRPAQGIANPEGWTPETVVSCVLPSLRRSFYDLEGTGGHLNWMPV